MPREDNILNFQTMGNSFDVEPDGHGGAVAYLKFIQVPVGSLNDKPIVPVDDPQVPSSITAERGIGTFRLKFNQHRGGDIAGGTITVAAENVGVFKDNPALRIQVTRNFDREKILAKVGESADIQWDPEQRDGVQEQIVEVKFQIREDVTYQTYGPSSPPPAKPFTGVIPLSDIAQRAVNLVVSGKEPRDVLTPEELKKVQDELGLVPSVEAWQHQKQLAASDPNLSIGLPGSGVVFRTKPLSQEELDTIVSPPKPKAEASEETPAGKKTKK